MLLVAGPAAPPGSVHVGIEPPSTGDDYASDDDSDEEVDDRPMTREELEDRTIARVRGVKTTGVKHPLFGSFFLCVLMLYESTFGCLLLTLLELRGE